MRRIASSAGNEEEVFSGKLVSSFPFIIICFFEVFFVIAIVMVLRSPYGSGIYMLVILMLFFLILPGGVLYYFRLTDDSLEIRNHIYWFFRKKYKLTEIERMRINESTGRAWNSLRVKILGSWSRSYFAGSFRNQDWEELGKALRKRGISVYNEFRNSKSTAGSRSAD